MKISGALFSFGLLVGLGYIGFTATSTVSAQEFSSTRACRLTNEVMQEEYLCDVEVNKQVSVNNGTFIDADTAGSASSATVGDTVTWKITITDNSFGFYEPDLEMLIADILPDGFSYVSHTVTSGEYIDGEWVLPTQIYVGEQEEQVSTLPAELVIITTADKAGTWENIATINSMNCDGWCDYEDGDSSNDSNSAFISVVEQTVPRVLGDSTTATPPVSTPQVLAATGSKIAIISFVVGLSLTGLVARLRKLSTDAK